MPHRIPLITIALAITVAIILAALYPFPLLADKIVAAVCLLALLALYFLERSTLRQRHEQFRDMWNTVNIKRGKGHTKPTPRARTR